MFFFFISDIFACIFLIAAHLCFIDSMFHNCLELIEHPEHFHSEIHFRLCQVLLLIDLQVSNLHPEGIVAFMLLY